MGYEVFERTAVRVEEPTLSLVPDGRIVLNAAACRVLKEAGVKAALLLWDRSSNRLAIKAAPKTDRNAYAVSLTGRHSGSLRTKAFLSYVGWVAKDRMTLPATWTESEKMLEVKLPDEYVRGGKAKETEDEVRVTVVRGSGKIKLT